VIAAVAAGHPATAEAGAQTLADGGNAADAAVAASLASCVAETVMTGMLGGGHAIYLDAASGQVRNLDCFVVVPSGGGAPMTRIEVPFGEELVHYAVGASSCAVPGLPAGLGELARAHGRLPWRSLVEPALQLARDGVALPSAHASCLAMLEPVMTMREGGRIYAPGGRLLGAGEQLDQPGLVRALELLRDEGEPKPLRTSEKVEKRDRRPVPVAAAEERPGLPVDVVRRHQGVLAVRLHERCCLVMATVVGAEPRDPERRVDEDHALRFGP